MNMNKLMKQAQQMQEKLQRELAELSVEATAGGGMVTVTMNGEKALLGIVIDPEVMDPADPAMLQDLIVAAVRAGQSKVDEEVKERVGGMAGGLPGGLF